MTAPVTSTQYTSAVIAAPADIVFEAVKALNFKWWKSVNQSNKNEDGTITVVYTDNTIQTIRQLEYSSLEMKVTWEVVASEPAAPTFSAVHTISCARVTTTNECFIAWNTDFSSDVSPAVIEDSKWKKSEAFQHMQEFCK